MSIPRLTVTSTSTRTIDHIVHLSPPDELETEIATWQRWGFNVIPGGTHADGLTENALIAFKDGAYLELISFTHPISHYPVGTPEREKREQHPWGKKPLGFIDFAFLGNDGNPSIAEIINSRPEAEENNVTYLKEVPGGRKRKDGEILKWLITAPSQASSDDEADIRGRLPFFCGDLTPRHLRVPSVDGDTNHPNSAVGVISLGLLVSENELETLSKKLTVVLGIQPDASANEPGLKWQLQSPSGEPGGFILLRLRLPGTDDERRWLDERGSGVYEVGVRIENSAFIGVNQTPYARLLNSLG